MADKGMLDSKSVTDADNGISNRRAHPRRSVLWPAKVTVGKHMFVCQVWNVSLGGARIKVDIPLRIGSKVLISVMSRPLVPAVIAWTEDEALGLEFETDIEEIRALLHDKIDTLRLEDGCVGSE